MPTRSSTMSATTFAPNPYDYNAPYGYLPHSPLFSTANPSSLILPPPTSGFAGADYWYNPSDVYDPSAYLLEPAQYPAADAFPIQGSAPALPTEEDETQRDRDGHASAILYDPTTSSGFAPQATASSSSFLPPSFGHPQTANTSTPATTTTTPIEPTPVNQYIIAPQLFNAHHGHLAVESGLPFPTTNEAPSITTPSLPDLSLSILEFSQPPAPATPSPTQVLTRQRRRLTNLRSSTTATTGTALPATSSPTASRTTTLAARRRVTASKANMRGHSSSHRGSRGGPLPPPNTHTSDHAHHPSYSATYPLPDPLEHLSQSPTGEIREPKRRRVDTGPGAPDYSRQYPHPAGTSSQGQVWYGGSGGGPPTSGPGGMIPGSGPQPHYGHSPTWGSAPSHHGHHGRAPSSGSSAYPGGPYGGHPPPPPIITTGSSYFGQPSAPNAGAGARPMEGVAYHYSSPVEMAGPGMAGGGGSSSMFRGGSASPSHRQHGPSPTTQMMTPVYGQPSPSGTGTYAPRTPGASSSSGPSSVPARLTPPVAPSHYVPSGQPVHHRTQSQVVPAIRAPRVPTGSTSSRSLSRPPPGALSGGSVSQFPPEMMMGGVERVLDMNAQDQVNFDHGLSEFPPRPYAGGVDAVSPWQPVKKHGKLYGSRLDQVSSSIHSSSVTRHRLFQF